jgi:predicted alpha/beta hydrolase family esterase
VAALSFLALAAAAVPIAAAALTWWGSAAQTEGRKSEQLPRAVVIRGFAGEWLATTAALVTWPFGFFASRAPAVADPRGVVLFLPDVGMNRSAFSILARRFRDLGWQVVDGTARRWRRQPDAGCATLAGRIRSVAAAASGKPLVVVAHGVAGLAARDCLHSEAEPAATEVRQLVTLATPHQGSTAAPYRWLVPDIDPASPRMGRFADAEVLRRAVEIVAISSPFDAWTVPAAAADCPGAFNIEIRAVGHFRFLYSRRVWELIAENLPNDQADRR